MLFNYNKIVKTTSTLENFDFNQPTNIENLCIFSETCELKSFNYQLSVNKFIGNQDEDIKITIDLIPFNNKTKKNLSK